MKTISIVIPCYNEFENIKELYGSIIQVCDKTRYTYEIIFVDDGSNDRSCHEFRRIEEVDNSVTVIRLGENLGQQVAIRMGLERSIGDAVIVMDADLQDPPALIPKMIECWECDHDVVHTQRISRDVDSYTKRMFARLFYLLFNIFGTHKIIVNAADFKLVDRKILSMVLADNTMSCFRVLVAKYCQISMTLFFHRNKRFAGPAKYSMLASMILALSIFSQHCSYLKIGAAVLVLVAIIANAIL